MNSIVLELPVVFYAINVMLKFIQIVTQFAKCTQDFKLFSANVLKFNAWCRWLLKNPHFAVVYWQGLQEDTEGN